MTPESMTRLRKILVVDDNAMNRAVAEGHLIAAGYSVRMAEDGERGIEVFQEWHPELVLLDVLMPGIDGYETCKRLKALPAGRDVPVVFLTALGDLSSHQKAIESGADDFLTKPINRTELLIRVRSLLWVKRLRDDLSQGYEIIRGQRDALVRAQRQKDELSALVVHDIKAPLSALLLNVQYVVRNEYLKDDHREALQDVLSSAESIRRMVVNLLDISRSESGDLVPHIAPLDLAGLVRQLCEILKRPTEEAHVSLTHDIQVNTIHADADLIERLLENLLDNSLKYTPAGGVIHIDARQTGDGFIDLRVSDQGAGIPEAQRERIFEKYVQLESDAVMPSRASRGIGLAFCRLAAEVHGGRIWAEANEPVGTVFCVRLPATGAEAAEILSGT